MVNIVSPPRSLARPLTRLGLGEGLLFVGVEKKEEEEGGGGGGGEGAREGEGREEEGGEEGGEEEGEERGEERGEGDPCVEVGTVVGVPDDGDGSRFGVGDVAGVDGVSEPG